MRWQSHNAIGREGTSKNTGSAREVADSRGSGRCGEHLCGNFQALQEVREGHAMSGSNMITTDRRERSNTGGQDSLGEVNMYAQDCAPIFLRQQRSDESD